MNWRYCGERTLGWMLNNKLIVFLSLLSFCLFVSTLALAGQRNRLSNELEELKASTVETTTVTTPVIEGGGDGQGGADGDNQGGSNGGDQGGAGGGNQGGADGGDQGGADGGDQGGADGGEQDGAGGGNEGGTHEGNQGGEGTRANQEQEDAVVVDDEDINNLGEIENSHVIKQALIDDDYLKQSKLYQIISNSASA